MPTLVTRFVIFIYRGDALGIITQDYETDKITTDEIYKGYSEITLLLQT